MVRTRIGQRCLWADKTLDLLPCFLFFCFLNASQIWDEYSADFCAEQIELVLVCAWADRMQLQPSSIICYVAGKTFKQWHLLIKFETYYVGMQPHQKECACLPLSFYRQGSWKTCQNQNEIWLKWELLPTPEVDESFIDGFSATGSRSAHLIHEDSACAKAKKIAFVENEKWIKPAEKLCVRTAASDKGGSEFKPSWWSAAFCRFLPQSKDMHRRSKAEAERSSDAECQGGCIDEWACCINHIKLWLFQRSEDLLD